MTAKYCPERLVYQSSSTPLHLVAGNGGKGIWFFVCEQAPLMTFQNHGLPARCPICGTTNPLSGEQQK
jgi:hypothetical protein